MISDYPLDSKAQITLLFRERNVSTWLEALRYVRALPYGRNSNRHDFSLVLTEAQGSCSSKHALLKSLAEQNAIPQVKLILGIYKMNGLNTPPVALVLARHGLEYMPEAHCYLSIEGERTDFTFPTSEFTNIETDILKEIQITPHQVVDFKPEFHRSFLKEWLKTSEFDLNFEEAWKIREECIVTL